MDQSQVEQIVRDQVFSPPPLAGEGGVGVVVRHSDCFARSGLS
jgi:hypothetical protein